MPITFQTEKYSDAEIANFSADDWKSTRHFVLKPSFEEYKMFKQNMQYNGLKKEAVLEAYSFVMHLRKETGFGQTRITRLVKERFNNKISENTVSGWIYSKNIPFNSQNTQFKPKEIPHLTELKAAYSDDKKSLDETGKLFSVSGKTMKNWIEKAGLKTRNHLESMNTARVKSVLREQKLFHPKTGLGQMSSEKAYVFGVLCGDAHINKRFIRFEIRNDEEFSKEFADCLNSIYCTKFSYSYYMSRNSFVLQANSEIICKDLLSCGEFPTYSWMLHDNLVESFSPKEIASFLRGYFDSEGTVGAYLVGASSVNKKGLVLVEDLLGRLGIDSKVYSCKNAYSLVISRKSNLKKFKELVGFTIIRKAQKLELMYGGKW